MYQPAALLICSFVLFLGVLGSVAAQEPYRLTLMHTNDTHAHHEPQASGEGGIARQATVVKQVRARAPNTLLLDAGDRFTGTLYYKYYQGRDNVRVMNALGYDAMTLGNHEFDNGLEVLKNFIAGVEFPVLTANVTIDQVAAARVLEVGGEKIGLIGLVTADTPEITMNFPGKEQLVWRSDYAAVVNAEVKKLSARGVNKIILLTHIGLTEDLTLAKQVAGVDVIVGGHSHTVLSQIYQEAGDKPYPIEASGADGAPVAIVQAGDRTRYLGRLDLEFDAAGLVTRARGDLILLSQYIAPDPQVQALLDELAEPIQMLKSTPVTGADGKEVVSERLLSNQDCRARECLLGNLITDAMRVETGAQVALQNGGGIRADIDEGPVSLGEVLTVLPFGNTIATMKLRGGDLLAALENGVARVGSGSGSGRFPQVSGLRYTFDPSKEPGARIASAEVQASDGSFKPVKAEDVYTVATNNFMRTGGDGYRVLVDKAIEPYDHGRPLEEALIDYMIAHHPLRPQLEGRITVRD